jgi:phage terminase large subunit-like protein
MSMAAGEYVSVSSQSDTEQARRGGKSLISALCGAYLALFHGYRGFLAPGERATVMLLASDVKQARQLIRYCKGLISASPMLARKVLNETKDALELTNRSVIEVNVANPRQTRGYTLAGVICDEIAFWPIDELSPKRDEDTRPALLTLPHSKLIAITSPYARRAAAWNAYRRHWLRRIEGACLAGADAGDEPKRR